MAKRRRLTPVEPLDLDRGAEPQPETKARYPFGVAPTRSRPPVSQIAGDAAEHAAFDELTRSVAAARAEGRLAAPLPLAAIAEDHLVRDRLIVDDDEMAALVASLEARGQQTPIEVVELEGGRYGLISGWRRVTALRRLGAETVLAVVRRPENAAAAYQAMVEENEIRVGLTYWERAHVAATAAGLGLYPDVQSAIAGLFASASRAKRSKIGTFAALHAALGASLRFPTALSERLGLALAAALSERPGFAAKLRDALRKAAPETPEAELAILERALRKGEGRAPAAGDEVAPGVFLKAGKGRAVVSGPSVDADLTRALAAWLARR